MRLPYVIVLFLVFLLPFCSLGQRVDYSDFISTRPGEQLVFAGEAGHHFWIEKDAVSRNRSRHDTDERPVRRFMVLNERLERTFDIDPPPVSYEKIYLVAGLEFFDQLSVRCRQGRTLLELVRFSADGSTGGSVQSLDSLGYAALPGQILLCRSGDRSRIFLMAFENLPDETNRVHTLLFDRNWHLLHRETLVNPGFSQPCIQDDLIGLPGEGFDNLPLKMGNRGDWVMTSVSPRDGHFVLVHGSAQTGALKITALPLNPFFEMEDVAMNLDEQKGECSIGLLSRYRKTSVKHVRVNRYSLAEDRMVFDSAFHFNSLSARLYNPALVNESFVGIPSGGFMLFKEYGRTGVVNTESAAEGNPVPGDPVFFSTLFSGGLPVPPALKEDSYLKKPGLQGMRSEFGRGNLSMFYFPSLSGDSTWSGLINTLQQTELNRPALSYLIFSGRDKIYILYHAGRYGFTEPGTTTSLDHQGKETGDAVIFWKLNRDLDFQQAVRFSADQIAVPFQNNQLTGFAVVRLQ